MPVPDKPFWDIPLPHTTSACGDQIPIDPIYALMTGQRELPE